MTTKLVRLRQSAFVVQSGLCYYCDLPMWEGDRELFALAYNIKPTRAQPLICTAEHLEARRDGGNDTPENIVAACRFCNVNRHRRKKAPSPGAFRQFVQRRLSKGRWHCRSLVKIFKPLAACHDSGVRARP
jgi:hypothetical protein